MTVALHSVSKWTRTARGLLRLFDELDIEIEDGDRTALLGTRRSGKSTILALLCGSEDPDSGAVERNRRISWPLPSGTSPSKSLTGVNYARFMARLYGIDEGSYVGRIKNLTGLGDLLNDRVKFWPKDERSKFTVALGLCIDFDLYLFDEKVSIGDKEFRGRCDSVLNSLDERKSIFLATQEAELAARYCTQAYVLHEGKALFFPAIEDAIAFFEPLNKTKAAGNEEDGESEGEDDDDPEATAMI